MKYFKENSLRLLSIFGGSVGVSLITAVLVLLLARSIGAIFTFEAFIWWTLFLYPAAFAIASRPVTRALGKTTQFSAPFVGFVLGYAIFAAIILGAFYSGFSDEPLRWAWLAVILMTAAHILPEIGNVRSDRSRMEKEPALSFSPKNPQNTSKENDPADGKDEGQSESASDMRHISDILPMNTPEKNLIKREAEKSE